MATLEAVVQCTFFTTRSGFEKNADVQLYAWPAVPRPFTLAPGARSAASLIEPLSPSLDDHWTVMPALSGALVVLVMTGVLPTSWWEPGFAHPSGTDVPSVSGMRVIWIVPVSAVAAPPAERAAITRPAKPIFAIARIVLSPSFAVVGVRRQVEQGSCHAHWAGESRDFR